MSATTLSPKSMPDVTPPAVITFPSLTIRAFSCVAPTRGRSSAKAQWVVARRPLSKPATPRMNAPVHTDVTYRAVLACLRTKSIVSSSPSASITPLYADGLGARSPPANASAENEFGGPETGARSGPRRQELAAEETVLRVSLRLSLNVRVNYEHIPRLLQESDPI